MKKSDGTVKNAHGIRLLQDVIRYEMKRAYDKWKALPNGAVPPFSRFLIKPETYEIADWVDRMRGDLVYLEMFVFEQRFIGAFQEAHQDPEVFDRKPEKWSHIRHLGKYTFRPGYRLPGDVIARWMERDGIRKEAFSKSEFNRLLDEYRLKGQYIPYVIETNLLLELYFRGYLESLLWLETDKSQLEFSIPEERMPELEAEEAEGFFRSMSASYSIKAFQNYQNRYRRRDIRERISSQSFLPRGANPLTTGEADDFYHVYTLPDLWRNYYGTPDDTYYYQNRDPIKADRRYFKRWDENLWAIKCLKKRMGRCAAIINYISWQYVLPQETSDSGDETGQGDIVHRRTALLDQLRMESNMEHNPRNGSYLSLLARETTEAEKDRTGIDRESRVILRKIAYETGYDGLTRTEKQTIAGKIRQSKKTAMAFQYARILDNRRFFAEMADVPAPASGQQPGSWINQQVNRIKKHFDRIRGWSYETGALSLCSASMSAASSGADAVERANATRNRYIQRGEIAIKTNPSEEGWILSGELFLKQRGRLLLLLLPDGDVIPLDIRNRTKVVFSGVPLSSRVSPGEIFFVLIKNG